MSTEELESKIKEFIDIVEKLPDRYRETCFEVLLSEYLSSKRSQEKIEEKAEVTPLPSLGRFTIPIDVRAFLQQHSVPEENIQKLFVMAGDEIRTTYTIETTKKSKAQIQLSLLVALENALKPGGKFEFSMEAVRQRCIDHKVYDRPHFKAHFKNNKELFAGLTDEEHVGLSPDGKAELAEVILELTK